MLDYPQFHNLKKQLALLEGVTEENLKSWRKARNITQKKLGELVGVSQQTIGKVEKGERPIPVRWLKIIEKIHPTHTEVPICSKYTLKNRINTGVRRGQKSDSGPTFRVWRRGRKEEK
jgi:transcriptional regulator with XRE-family HTH domain